MIDCSPLFYNCWEGQSSFQQCNEGLVFSAKSASCVPSNECGMNFNEIPLTTQATIIPEVPVTEAPIGTSGFCSAKSNGVYANDICSGFFICCFNNEFKWLMCPGGNVFDSSILRCVPQSQCVIPQHSDGIPRHHSIPFLVPVPQNFTKFSMHFQFQFQGFTRFLFWRILFLGSVFVI